MLWAGVEESVLDSFKGHDGCDAEREMEEGGQMVPASGMVDRECAKKAIEQLWKMSKCGEERKPGEMSDGWEKEV